MSLVEQRPRGTRDAGPEEVIRLNVKKKRKRDGTKKADPKESRNDPEDRLVSSRGAMISSSCRCYGMWH